MGTALRLTIGVAALMLLQSSLFPIYLGAVIAAGLALILALFSIAPVALAERFAVQGRLGSLAATSRSSASRSRVSGWCCEFPLWCAHEPHEPVLEV
jgi:hypothetical protein